MLSFIRHLFVPHVKNNHRAKLLHNASLLVLLVILLSGSLLVNVLKQVSPEVLGVTYSISQNELLVLVNQKRAENNLSPLSANPALDDAARRKASDMLSKNYWAHFAPDGSSSPWDFIRASGYDYTYAGENLAKGFTESGAIVDAWMNSPTHRDNILSGRYNDVGFAIVPGSINGEETVLVVEMFGARSNTEVAAIPQATVEAVSISPPVSPTAAPQSGSQPAKVETQKEIVTRPTVDTRITSQAASTVGLSFLAFAFIMDLLIVERKKIPRIVGHNVDHVILILLFLLFIILRSRGVII